ncbi:MAG TPA: GNAT family N-acetyltransferase [Bradyrhizobium sp.]|nr:GNAT family N-acetyltransferase [Bradyrhizobium sp.]
MVRPRTDCEPGNPASQPGGKIWGEMIRKAEEQDASPLAAVSIEVWLNTYVRDGVSPLFADYVLSEFTAQKFRNAMADPDLAIWVSENRIGIDGFVTVCSTATSPPAGCSGLEIATLYVQPRHHSSGKGAALLHCALDHCRRMSGESAWLKVNAENGRAIDFYLRHGFVRIGTTPFVIADKAYENHVMAIDLRHPAPPITATASPALVALAPTAET